MRWGVPPAPAGELAGVYDPLHFNDRLLLGLKGTTSEAELHVLKHRMFAGRDAKAARGELGMLLPVGYVRRPSGEVVQDADEQVNRAERWRCWAPGSVAASGTGCRA